MLVPPPYTLATIAFPFRALTALAGRLPMGGDREVVMALLVAARLAAALRAPETLAPATRRARARGARQWCSVLALPAGVRNAFVGVAEATTDESSAGVAAALDRLVGLAGTLLDPAARAEVKHLIGALRAS